MNFFLTALLLPTTVTAFVVQPLNSRQVATISLHAELNGWVPDESEFDFGLPGALDPVGNFDPLGISTDTDLDQMKACREAETTHGRVSMLAIIGFLVTEEPISYHPLFNAADKDIGPAI